MVIITSATAIPNNLYECIPLPGSPKAFLYLHRFIYFTCKKKSVNYNYSSNNISAIAE